MNKDAHPHDPVSQPIRLGSWLAQVGREVQLTDEEFAGFQRLPAAEAVSPLVPPLDGRRSAACMGRSGDSTALPQPPP